MTHTPQALIFTVVTFVAAFIPVVGASAVVLSASALMFVTGHSTAALFLAGWVVFFSLLGGVAMFGPAGLLAPDRCPVEPAHPGMRVATPLE